MTEGLPNDIARYVPGDKVPVEALADANGDVPLRGDGVIVTGENQEFVEVEQAAGQNGDALGILLRDPEDYDSSTSYSDGDSAGRTELLLFKPVLMFTVDSGYSATVGDYVQFSDGGDVVQQSGLTASSVSTLTNTLGVDGSGNLEHDGGSDIDVPLIGGLPFGVVFSTLAQDFNESGKVAVAVYR